MRGPRHLQEGPQRREWPIRHLGRMALSQDAADSFPAPERTARFQRMPSKAKRLEAQKRYFYLTLLFKDALSPFLTGPAHMLCDFGLHMGANTTRIERKPLQRKRLAFLGRA